MAIREILPRPRTLAFVAGGLALFVLLLGAFFYEFGGWTLSAPADLTIANGDEPQTLDPAIVTAQLDQRICLAIYEGLTSCDPAGHITPGVAQSWEISLDGKTYTFHLRRDAKWSNGDPLTARDFVESWQRVLDPATASDYAYQLFYLVNGEAYYNRNVTDFSQVGVRATDDHTLVVTLNHPTAYFLQLTAAMQTLFPVHLATVKKYGDNWTKPGNIVGNGPYLLKQWRLNDYILLEANPNYWRPVAIKRIRVLPTRDANTCFNLFYSGKIDLILDQSSIPPVLLPDIRQQPYYHRNPIGAATFVRFNVKRKPFDDVRVRKALALGLDKQDIVDKIIRTGEPVADTLVPPGDAGYVPPQGLQHDLAEARRLLAEAGYPGGRGFPDVSLLYSTKGSGLPIATEMQALWARDLGITSIHLRGQEFKVYLNSQSSIDFDLCISHWIGDYADPQTFLDMFVTAGGNNDTNWSDPAYDKLLADSEMTPDPAQRMKMLQQMEKILVEEQLPVFPISFTVGAVLYHPGKLGGFVPNILDDHPWGDLYIPREKIMGAIIIRRLITAIPVLFIVVSLTFALMHYAPGSPFTSGRHIPASILAALEKKYQLDGPFLQQYGKYLWDLAHGDLGLSLQLRNRTVNEIIGQSLPVSMVLGTLAYTFALFAGITLGGLAAVRHGRAADRWLMLAALLGISVPNFVLAIAVIHLFAIDLNLLPVAGWGSLDQLILPAFCLSVPFVASITRLTRGGLLEVLRLDFIRTARAKGLSGAAVLFRHALKVAILPIIGYSGPAIAGILTGSIIVETIFGIPGIGPFFINSVLNRDPFMTCGVVLVFGLFLIICNLVADILYFVVDRRVTLE